MPAVGCCCTAGWRCIATMQRQLAVLSGRMNFPSSRRVNFSGTQIHRRDAVAQMRFVCSEIRAETGDSHGRQRAVELSAYPSPHLSCTFVHL